MVSWLQQVMLLVPTWSVIVQMLSMVLGWQAGRLFSNIDSFPHQEIKTNDDLLLRQYFIMVWLDVGLPRKVSLLGAGKRVALIAKSSHQQRPTSFTLKTSQPDSAFLPTPVLSNVKPLVKLSLSKQLLKHFCYNQVV